MLDPEAADAFVAAGQREAVGRLGVREEGGIEVDADPQPSGPVDPPLEVGRLDPVAVDRPGVALQVHGVQVEPVPARNEAIGRLQIATKLVGGSGLSGIGAGGHDSPVGEPRLALEPAHVVALPAVHRDGDPPEPFEGGVGIHAQFRIAFVGQPIRFLDRCRFHGTAPSPWSREARRPPPDWRVRRAGDSAMIVARTRGDCQGARPIGAPAQPVSDVRAVPLRR